MYKLLLTAMTVLLFGLTSPAESSLSQEEDAYCKEVFKSGAPFLPSEWYFDRKNTDLKKDFEKGIMHTFCFESDPKAFCGKMESNGKETLEKFQNAFLGQALNEFEHDVSSTHVKAPTLAFCKWMSPFVFYTFDHIALFCWNLEINTSEKAYKKVNLNNMSSYRELQFMNHFNFLADELYNMALQANGEYSRADEAERELKVMTKCAAQLVQSHLLPQIQQQIQQQNQTLLEAALHLAQNNPQNQSTMLNCVKSDASTQTDF